MNAPARRRRAPHGRLRAGLDVGLLVALLAALTIGAERLARAPGAPSSLGISLGAALGAGLLLLALSIALAWRDPDRRGSLGFGGSVPWQRSLRYGLLGAGGTYLASGVVALGFLFATTGALRTVATSGALQTKTEAIASLTAIPWWTLLPIALFAGFYEEVVFRGLLLRRLLTALGGQHPASLVGAILLSSALFAAGHLYQGALGVAQTFAAGICLAVLAAKTGSIRACIVAHVTINTVSLLALRVLRPWFEQAAAAGG